MIIYDYLGNIKNHELSDYNYNLIIDFDHISFRECYSILELLNDSSSLCQKDIILLANHIIENILLIQYDIIKPQYKDLVQLIHYIFKILKKINNKTELMIIYHNFNRFITKPTLSNPSSPVSPPPVIKKMKKMKKIKS